MIHNILLGKKVVLASASPRRKEIFDFIGVKTLIVPSNYIETNFTVNPRKLVKEHALQKALTVKKQMDSDCLIIGSDTIVVLNKVILGKPKCNEDVIKFLELLSGETHSVYTGISIVYKNIILQDFEKTRVTFKTLSRKEIDEYISTSEPFDKAGAYGIQGYGSQFIKKINGCYFNVMGFPVNNFYNLLEKIEGK
ncbi:MAG: Maf family protein [Candidatus Cloacimonetes bacterium]|nr:Maf family protein [Candidatus Cloacimonadota bacterium]